MPQRRTIANASGGEDTSLDGTEKFPVTGSKYALISSILEYIRTATSTFTNKTLTSPTINSPAIGGDVTGSYGTLAGFKGAINAQTGTTYATVDSDHGKVITLSNGSAITITVHQAATAGFNCMIIQLGAGQVTVAAGGTGAVRNRSSHTKLAGQYAMGSLFVVSNAGTAPQVYLAGDTGT
jgi:predicted secreted protein